MARAAGPWWLSLVTLVLGLGVGWLLWAETPAAQTPLPDLDVGSDAPVEAPGALRAADGATLEGRAHDDAIARALDLGAEPEPERGSGVIRGRVVDEAGRPVPDVRVRLDARGDHQRFHPGPTLDDPDAELERRIRGMIAQHRWGRAYRRTTRTGADGTFRFVGLPDVDYQLQAQRDGWFVYLANPAQHRSVRSGAQVDFRARPQARLQLRFVGAQPSGQMEVALKQGNGGTSTMYWSAQQRWLDVQPGRADLVVRGGRYGELRGGPYPVELVAGAEPTVVDVTFESAPVLDLEIRFPEGFGIEQTAVGALPQGHSDRNRTGVHGPKLHIERSVIAASARRRP